jgi:hypothetical protein
MPQRGIRVISRVLVLYHSERMFSKDLSASPERAHPVPADIYSRGLLCKPAIVFNTY